MTNVLNLILKYYSYITLVDGNTEEEKDNDGNAVDGGDYEGILISLWPPNNWFGSLGPALKKMHSSSLSTFTHHISDGTEGIILSGVNVMTIPKPCDPY